MPTFTALALDRLIEPGASKSMAPGKKSSDKKLERRHSTNSNHCPAPRPERSNGTKSTMPLEKKHHWAWISPALYATPESTPLPDSPSSFPPSPYIINHKRRGPRLLKSSSQNDVAIHQRDQDEEKAVENAKSAERKVVDRPVEEMDVNGVHDGAFGSSESSNELAGENRSPNNVTFVEERDGEAEDFYDFHDSMSVKSSNEGESTGVLERSFSVITPMAEFYDAWEGTSLLFNLFICVS